MIRLSIGCLSVSLVLRRVTCIALLLSMYACGGGNSDGSGTGGGGGGGTAVRGLTASSTSLTFSINSLYAMPPRQEVTVTADSADWQLRFEFPAPFNAGSISKSSPTQYVIQIGAQPGASVGVGTFSGDLLVTACADDSSVCNQKVAGPLRIRLTHTITGVGIAAGFNVSLLVGPSAAPSPPSRTETVYSSAPWTAVSSLPQMTVTPASGNGPRDNITVALTEAAISQLQLRYGNHPASITFSNGTSQYVHPVEISMNAPEVLTASPRVIPAQDTSPVSISGNLLTFYSPPSVLFGTTAGSNPVSNSSQMLRVNPPALNPGTYPVALQRPDGSVLPRSIANIVVVAPLGAPAQALTYPDGRARRITDLHFDAEHPSLVLAVQYPAQGESATEILRYPYNSGWSTPTVRPMPFLASLMPRGDGLGWMATGLLNGTSDNAMFLCAADLGSCQTALTAPLANRRWTRIAANNSERHIVLGSSYPDPAAAGDILSFSTYDNLMRTLATSVVADGVIGTSANGETVLVGSQGLQAGAVRPLYAASALGNSAGVPVAMIQTEAIHAIAVDREATRLLLNKRRVVDFIARVERASLPSTTLASTLNRAGTRAYTFDSDGRVHVFDVSTGQSTGNYPEVGNAIVPAADPGPGTDGQDMQITLSPDDKTLFLAGSNAVVVQPIP